MYKETLRPRERSALLSILAIVGLIAGIMVAASLLLMLSRSIQFAYSEYIIYILFIALGVFIVRKRLTSYNYAIMDDELLLEKMIGTGVKTRESVALEHVTGFMRWEAYERQGKGAASVNKQTYRTKAGAYALCYEQDEEKQVIMFHPSEKLAAHIRERIGQL